MCCVLHGKGKLTMVRMRIVRQTPNDTKVHRLGGQFAISPLLLPGTRGRLRNPQVGWGCRPGLWGIVSNGDLRAPVVTSGEWAKVTPLNYESPSKSGSAWQLLGTVIVIVGAVALAAIGVAAYGWTMSWLYKGHSGRLIFELLRHPTDLIVGLLLIVLAVYKCYAKAILRRIYRPGYRYKKAGVMTMDLVPRSRTQTVANGPESPRVKLET